MNVPLNEKRLLLAILDTLLNGGLFSLEYFAR